VLSALIGTLLMVYSFILLGRVIMSWLPDLDPENPIVQFLYGTTEPVLMLIRQALPPMAGLDLSPMILMLILWLLRGALPG
jgi:YggT family protein